MIVEFYPEAFAELSEATDYYNFQKPGLEMEFLDIFHSAVITIQHSPNRWPILSKSCRRYLLNRFPFSIYYKLIDDTLWIVAIAHHSRKPGYWRSRMKH